MKVRVPLLPGSPGFGRAASGRAGVCEQSVQLPTGRCCLPSVDTSLSERPLLGRPELLLSHLGKRSCRRSGSDPLVRSCAGGKEIPSALPSTPSPAAHAGVQPPKHSTLSRDLAVTWLCIAFLGHDSIPRNARGRDGFTPHKCSVCSRGCRSRAELMALLCSALQSWSHPLGGRRAKGARPAEETAE